MPEGYVVWAKITYNEPGDETMPLRNFGNYRSAAMEFRNFINDGNADPDKLERLVRGWGRSYDQNVRYSYAKINDKGTIIILKKA